MGYNDPLLRPTFRQAAPRGVTFIEFVGCLTAVVGGVVLGTAYMGIDLQASCLQILAKAGVIQVQSQAQVAVVPTSENGAIVLEASQTEAGHASASLLFAQDDSNPKPESTAEAAQAAVSDAQMKADAAQSIGSSVAEMAADLSSSVRNALEARLAEVQAADVPAEERAALTQAYWSKLCGLIDADAERRDSNQQGNDLFELISKRADSHAKAAAGIDQIPLKGIDPHVAAYALRLHQWHADGAEHYRLAARLLTDAPTAALSGPLAKAWQNAETQHQMEEKLLLEKHVSISAYLEHARAKQDETQVDLQ